MADAGHDVPPRRDRAAIQRIGGPLAQLAVAAAAFAAHPQAVDIAAEPAVDAPGLAAAVVVVPAFQVVEHHQAVERRGVLHRMRLKFRECGGEVRCGRRRNRFARRITDRLRRHAVACMRVVRHRLRHRMTCVRIILRGCRHRMPGMWIGRVRAVVHHRHGVARMRVILCGRWHCMASVWVRFRGCRHRMSRVGIVCAGLGLRFGVAGMRVSRWRCRRVVAGMRVLCERRAAGGQGEEQQRVGKCLHASILTSRIMPASMWYSRWQWKAQRPSASARTR